MVSLDNRVVITGAGLIGPLGLDVETLWDALSTGRSGVRSASEPWMDELPTSVVAAADGFSGKIDDFGPLEKGTKKALRKGLKVMCRECQMGVAAAQRALTDAGASVLDDDPTRLGVSFGSEHMITQAEDLREAVQQCVDLRGVFDARRWASDGIPKMSPLWLLLYLPNMPACHFAIYNDLRGPNNSVTVREASGNLAIAEAAQIIRRGGADVMICGGTGSRVHPVRMINAVQQMEVARGDQDPTLASRPFDRDRSGMVLGEGAGAIILERRDRAERRGATLLGEVVTGCGSVVAEPGLAPRPKQAIENVLSGLLAMADISPDAIGHLNAHGVATVSDDLAEAQAIAAVFAQRKHPLPVVTVKGHQGNLGAGGGVIELIASLQAMQHDRLFPVLNHETPDPACPIHVVTTADIPPGDTFINLSVTPQAQASALLVRRP